MELMAIQDRVRLHIPNTDQITSGHEERLESDKQGQTDQSAADIWAQEEPDEDYNERAAEMVGDIPKKWEVCRQMPINERPAIPKIRKNHLAKEAIRHANEAVQNIKDKTTKPLNLTEINQLVYAAASSVAETVGAKGPRQPKGRKRTQQNGVSKSRKRYKNYGDSYHT